MIKRLKIVLLFCAVACNSQIVDTITIHCNLEYYKKEASKRVELQYAFTQKNYNELKKIYKSNIDTLLILTDFPLKSFEVHSIPFFKIKDDLITNFKENFVNSINFSNNL